VIVVDRLLVGGIRFVLDKLAQAVDSELNDSERLRQELLALQMQLELGEISERELAEREQPILERLRELKREELDQAEALRSGEYRVAGIDAELHSGHRRDD